MYRRSPPSIRYLISTINRWTKSGYLAKIFGARLLLIYSGKQTLKLQTTLDEIYERSGINLRETTMVWFEGDPVKTLLEICKEHSVDLLILETIRRERVLRHYLGSVTRGMSRSAKCSLLLLTEPTTRGTTFKKIVVSNFSFSIPAIHQFHFLLLAEGD